MDLELGLGKSPARRSHRLLPELHVAATILFVCLLGVATIILSSAGSWNGCVLSAAWCTGEGALAAPYESMRRGLVAAFGAAGVSLNLRASMGATSLEGLRHAHGPWLQSQTLSTVCQLCVLTCCVVRSY